MTSYQRKIYIYMGLKELTMNTLQQKQLEKAQTD